MERIKKKNDEYLPRKLIRERILFIETKIKQLRGCYTAIYGLCLTVRKLRVNQPTMKLYGKNIICVSM